MHTKEYAGEAPEVNEKQQRELLGTQILMRLPDILKLSSDMFVILANYEEAVQRDDMAEAEKALEQLNEKREKAENIKREIKQIAGINGE